MAVLTLADVLAMPAVRRGAPRVLAGHGRLDTAVRWVHSGELADIGPLLREGDLLLSTGIAMPGTDEGLREMAAGLAAHGAAGLVIELGRRWAALPPVLVEACDACRLPLVALGREVRFAAVAQAVGERIVDEQLTELREAQRVHDTFTDLSIAEAGPAEILEAVERLAGAAVVLESEQHQVLDFRPGPREPAAPPAADLADWARLSRSIAFDGRTSWDPRTGWLVTRVGKRDRGWGRLAVQGWSAPTEGQIAMVERAAAALALHRLHDRQRDSVVRRTHHELLLALLADPGADGLPQRCELAGLRTSRRQLVGLTLRPRAAVPLAGGAPRLRLDEVTAAVAHTVAELDVPALVSDLEGDVRVLLSLPAAAAVDPLVDELAARVRRRQDVGVSAGRPVRSIAEADRTLREAQQVMASLGRATLSRDQVHRLDDAHLRGLLALLADDERVRLFAERELAALREHDSDRERDQRGSLLEAVRALVLHPTSKSDAAASLHVSRPVFYDRIAKAERVLGASLDDPDLRVSLHVALLADELTGDER